jgi:Family of unknown function (DUF5670)
VEKPTQKPAQDQRFCIKYAGLSLKMHWQHFFTIPGITYLLKQNIMRSILYIIAVILIIGWLIGVFAYSATGLIHVLIVLAVISLLLAIIRRA